MPKYRKEADGALYPLPERVPLNTDTLHLLHRAAEDFQRQGSGGLLDEAREDAIEVLRQFADERIELDPQKRFASLDGVRWSMPRDAPELVKDANWVLYCACQVDRYAAQLGEGAGEDAIGMIIANSAKLGAAHARMITRAGGVESDVFGRRSQKRNLRPRPKVDIDEQTLRDEWERAKRLKPNANKMVWRESVADRLGTSESTIKRRLADFKII